jgi:2'-5' RNA ligase
MQYGYRDDSLEGRGVGKYAVVIFLPDYLQKLVAPIRERFDPDYSLVDPNVAIVGPFDTARTLDEVSKVIGQRVRKLVAPKIEFDSLGDYYPRYPLIFWKLKNNPELDGLCRTLYADLEVALPYRQFSPHVTVAREISQHRLMLVKERIYPYLPEESFVAGSVDLIAPVGGQRWVSVRTFPFQPEE